MGTNQPEGRCAGAAKYMGIVKLKSKFTGSVKGEDAGLGSKVGSSTGRIGLSSNRMEFSEVWDLPGC